MAGINHPEKHHQEQHCCKRADRIYNEENTADPGQGKWWVLPLQGHPSRSKSSCFLPGFPWLIPDTTYKARNRSLPGSKDKLGVLGGKLGSSAGEHGIVVIQASRATAHLLWLLFPLTVWFSVVNGPIPLILAGGLAGLGGGHGAARGTGAVLALGHIWGLHAGTTAAAAAAGEGALPFAVFVHTQVQSPIFIHLNVHGLKG